MFGPICPANIGFCAAGLCLLALGAGSLQAEPGQPVAPAAPRAATAATRAVLAEAAKSLPAEDGVDFEFSRRGFIATWPEQIIRQANGKPSFDLSANDFIEGPAPDTVNPALWRQNRVLRAEGLFRLAPGLYQVRNFDNSNVTFIETPKGWIVIDPLTVEEVAKAAFDLLKKHVADKPVLAVIYAGPSARTVPTTEELWLALNQGKIREAMADAPQVARRARAFHWPLEFPDVMQRGGFDAVVGNPPWEKYTT